MGRSTSCLEHQGTRGEGGLVDAGVLKQWKDPGSSVFRVITFCPGFGPGSFDLCLLSQGIDPGGRRRSGVP